MTQADLQTAVVIIRHGWADRVPAGAIESRVRRALPAITLEDLEAAGPAMFSVTTASAGWLGFWPIRTFRSEPRQAVYMPQRY